MKIKKGDTVTFDFSDLDAKAKKAFGKNLTNKVEGTVDEVVKSKDGKIWIILTGSKPDDYMIEMYSKERIVKLNGQKI